MGGVVLKSPTIFGNRNPPWEGVDGKGYVRLPDSWSETEGVHTFGILFWNTDILDWEKFPGTNLGPSSNVTVLSYPGPLAAQLPASLGTKAVGDSLSVVPATSSIWSSSQQTVAATIPAEGKLSGTALTGSYQPVLDPSGDAKVIWLRNTCNKAIVVSFDGGSTNHVTLDPRESQAVIDLGASGLKNSGIISAKHDGVVPTSGRIKVTVMK